MQENDKDLKREERESSKLRGWREERGRIRQAKGTPINTSWLPEGSQEEDQSCDRGLRRDGSDSRTKTAPRSSATITDECHIVFAKFGVQNSSLHSSKHGSTNPGLHVSVHFSHFFCIAKGLRRCRLSLRLTMLNWPEKFSLKADVASSSQTQVARSLTRNVYILDNIEEFR